MIWRSQERRDAKHVIRRLITGGSTTSAVLNLLKRAGRGKGTDQEKAEIKCSEVQIRIGATEDNGGR